MLMKGMTHFTTTFNINGVEIYGAIKKNITDIFVEIKEKNSNNIYQKIYNGDINNEEQMISEIENLIEENFNDNY